MIELSRLNGHPIVVNAELLKFVEQNPDTVITLVTGDKLVVREAAPEVIRRVLEYRRSLGQHALSLSPAANRPDREGLGPSLQDGSTHSAALGRCGIPPQHANGVPSEPVVGSLGQNNGRAGDPVEES